MPYEHYNQIKTPACGFASILTRGHIYEENFLNEVYKYYYLLTYYLKMKNVKSNYSKRFYWWIFNVTFVGGSAKYEPQFNLILSDGQSFHSY